MTTPIEASPADPPAGRMAPAAPPFPDEVQRWLDRVMPPGVPPLRLFTTLARDPRLFQRFMGGGLLDRGNLTLRQRELVILRVTARCGSEYEWGVHVALFGARVAATPAELVSLVHGAPEDPCWADDERALLEVCDQLHARLDVDEPLWRRACAAVGEEGVLEVLMLASFYRGVAYLTNATRLPLEPFAARFPAAPVAR
jgi:alkylhydroperoxidase family enzyme